MNITLYNFYVEYILFLFKHQTENITTDVYKL